MYVTQKGEEVLKLQKMFPQTLRDNKCECYFLLYSPEAVRWGWCEGSCWCHEGAGDVYAQCEWDRLQKQQEQVRRLKTGALEFTCKEGLHVYFCWQPYSHNIPGQKRADITAVVAAEAEKGTDTETEIGIRTEGEGIVPDHAPDPGLAPETAIATEREIAANEKTNLPDGPNAHLAPEKTKTEIPNAGRTNTWTALPPRSLLLVTYTTAKWPVSCSLDASFSWKAWGQSVAKRL